MAIESTNDWTIKNKISYPHYETPFAVLADPVEVEPPKLNIVKLDLYKGQTFKTSVSYLVGIDATDDEADIAMWDAINKAKSDYLQEKYA